MHHHHHHGHHPQIDQRKGNKKGLTIAFVITTGIMLLEFFGGLVTNSLALLSDSGHMLSDAGSLGLSLLAMRFATRPPSPYKTFGFYRFEVLAALFNAVTLFVIAGFIIWEAVQRFIEPPRVAGGSMMVIALIGLVANLFSAWSLVSQGDVKGNVNLRSAYLHVIGDALGSIGAIVAGLMMMLFSWYLADPFISVLVALLILKSAWGVLRQTIHILMEGTPVAIDQKEVRKSLRNISGVSDVHDLHIWTITSGLDALSCHLVIEEDRDGQKILREALQKVEEEFHIRHTTIQIETSCLQYSQMIV
ncbi:cation diffusion facilitator family transporter [Paludifilum halophilum]|uniref:Cation transporter n=1 Tax=Paludifilum halophilum TaxID=1642702 RepID=A0A235B1T5_9BACL|nr:cation diffusion facilitator family transporter [Paludifilum halophilum]OYD06268.1 cation transporter [Paludifilum halophilum]